MEDALSKLFAVMMAVILLFYYPLMGLFDTQERTQYAFILSETTLFVDTVCNRGELTPTMYAQFIESLEATRTLFDVQLEHRHRVYVPVYGDPGDPTTFQNTYTLHYDTFYTKGIRETLYSGGVAAEQGYGMSSGDYFAVTLCNRDATLATRVKGMLLGQALPKETLVLRYGGMVK